MAAAFLFSRKGFSSSPWIPTCASTVYTATSLHVFRSADGGVTWQPLSNGLGDVYISSLEIDPSKTNVLYLGTQGDGVMKLQQ